MNAWPQLAPDEKTKLFLESFPFDRSRLPNGLTIGHLMDVAEQHCASVWFSRNGDDWMCAVWTPEKPVADATSKTTTDALAQALLKLNVITL